MIAESTFAVRSGVAALVAAVSAADSGGAEVGVFWGEPGPAFPREFVCIMGAQVDVAAATMGTTRTRDETIRTQINIVANRQGTDAQQQSAARAYTLLAALETRLRTDDPTLGGACWQCLVTRIEESGGTPPGDRAAGRYTEIIAELTARVRITN